MEDATSIAIALGIVVVMLGVVSLVRRMLLRLKDGPRRDNDRR